MNLICISNSTPIWQDGKHPSTVPFPPLVWRMANSHCRTVPLGMALKSCGSISRGKPQSLRRSFNHRSDPNVRFMGVPSASPPAHCHRGTLQLSTRCCFRGTSSGETLTPHPQLLAQHIPTDKGCGEKIKEKQPSYKLIDFFQGDMV